MKTAKTKTKDGRALRSERTREAMTRALYDLITEGNPEPSAKDIADRAGVTERLVFHHYKDLEALNRDMIQLEVKKLEPLLEIPVRVTDPFEKRLDIFVQRRAALLETMTPGRSAGLLRIRTSPSMAAIIHLSRAFKQAQVSDIFEPELAKFSDKERKMREAALQSATEWSSWDTMRHHQELSHKAAASVMSFMVRAILSEVST